MATLTSKSVASTYTSLLKLEGNTGSTVAGASGNAVQVKTGDNDATPLYLNTDRIGIGTTSPAKPLHVSSSVGAQVMFSREDTSIAADDELGRLCFGGDDPTDGTYQQGAFIKAIADAEWGTVNGSADTTDCPTRLEFATVADGTNSLATAMTIDSTANVGIRTSTFDGSAIGYLAIKNGTEPSAHTDDQVYIGAKNSAGTGTDTLSTLAIFTEEGVDATALDAVGTLTTRIPIWVNGTAYWLYLDPV